MSNSEYIRAENLTKTFAMQDNRIEVLKGLDLAVSEREFVGIMGKSGSGKTTLLKLLALLDKPSGGNILYKGRDSRSIYGDDLFALRRREMGFIYQDYYLMESLSVMENIMLPGILEHKDADECIRRAKELARIMEIGALLGKRPSELSGGEKQKTAICRALFNDPEIIFADEPTGNLDSVSSDIVMKYFEMINKDLKKTILLVTHDPGVASCCGRVVFMKDGHIGADIICDESQTFYDRIIEMQKDILHTHKSV